MNDDEQKKAFEFVQSHFRDVLKQHLGAPLTKDRVDAVKDEIKKVLDKIATNHGAKIETLEIVGDEIRYKLSQPGFARQILPVLEGPFVPWHEGGVVHVAGKLGDWEVRVCDYQPINPGGYECPTSMVTCLECLVANKESTATAT